MEGAGVYAPEVLDFVRSANEYCSWLEGSEEESSVVFIKTSIVQLSNVYAKVVCIKELEPVMESDNERFVSEQDWSVIYQKVMSKLGRFHSYLRIADSDEFDRSDLVTHTVSEDMADIFQDLKDFIMVYRQGIEEMMNDAVWEVMDNFEQYWSDKLLSALKALNKLYVKKIDPESADAAGKVPENTDVKPSYDSSFFTRLQDSNQEEV